MLRNKMKMAMVTLKKATENATFAAIISAILAFLLGTFVGTSQYQDAITYKTISSYIDSLLVSPGLVDAKILTLQTPFEQLSMIANTMNLQQSTYNKLRAQLQNSSDSVDIFSDDFLYDCSGFDYFNGNSHFTMVNEDYSYGITNHDNNAGTVYIDCAKEYSRLYFIIGHVNGTSSNERKLKVSFRNSDEQFVEIVTIQLYGEMLPKAYSIPIFNTKTVKLEINDGETSSDTAKYGLVDISLSR